MTTLSPGWHMILLGLSYLTVGSAASFALPQLDLSFLDFQFVLVVYLLMAVLTFSGMILTILGVGTALRGSRRDGTIDIL